LTDFSSIRYTDGVDPAKAEEAMLVHLRGIEQAMLTVCFRRGHAMTRGMGETG
jgi:hypothetical protein